MIGHQPFYNPYYQQFQQPTSQQQVAQQPQTIQNGGFVLVRSENDVQTYPVAPGNVVTFKIENQPLIIEKTQGFSQFEAPRYKRWRMTEEEIVITPQENPEPAPDYAMRADIERLQAEIDEIKGQITQKKRPAKKDEEVE